MAMLDEAAADLQRTLAALRRELDERTAERDEALAQQAATGEILSAISRSPANIQPVFEAIVARAATLCEAEFSAVAKLDDGLLHLVAVHSLSPEETAAFYSLFPRSPERNFAMGRAFLDAQSAHFEDVLTEADYDTRTLETLQSMAKYRSFLGVPIFREGRPIGVIGCGRQEVRGFTPAQIELVKIFADQAAIAIENVRLFGELEARNREVSEALEKQIARRRCWKSSMPRPATSRRSSMRCSKRRRGCPTPLSGLCRSMSESVFGRLLRAECRLP
jgi:GAF domain-containing protein